MFSTCLFCHASLGANESIEHFPVGKRLAFDSEKGRLWAVCPKCTRWNLTPLEERWEALDECERAYRGTRTRVSTDNIALARLRDGTDLVRIGRPLLPELATWRYGGQLRTRRRAYIASGVALGTIALGSVAVGSFGLTALVGISGVGGVVGQWGFEAYRSHQRKRPVGWLPAPRGFRHSYGTEHADTLRISASPENTLTISMDYRRRGPKGSFLDEVRKLELVGREASELLTQVIVHVNRAGASRTDVVDAAREVEQHTGSGALLARASGYDYVSTERQGLVRYLPPRVRLGLEMSLHAEDERRALAGELGALYARWEEAERIAKIADDELTLPPS